MFTAHPDVLHSLTVATQDEVRRSVERTRGWREVRGPRRRARWR